MLQITIAYLLRLQEGVEFDEISFNDTIPTFKNMVLRPIDRPCCKYELLITKNVYSTERIPLTAIFSETAVEADMFKYIFSVASDLKIFDFECIGYYDNGQLIKYDEIFGSINTIGSANLIHNPDEAFVNDLKKKMEVEYDLPSVQRFYDAATIIEPIGRFLSLYAILLYKFGPHQKEVDEAILRVDPTVGESKSPHTKNYETTFTKLRNQMSHRREGTNLMETQNGIKLNLERFEAIVKQLFVGKSA